MSAKYFTDMKSRQFEADLAETAWLLNTSADPFPESRYLLHETSLQEFSETQMEKQET